jgi:hypothetical protein
MDSLFSRLQILMLKLVKTSCYSVIVQTAEVCSPISPQDPIAKWISNAGLGFARTMFAGVDTQVTLARGMKSAREITSAEFMNHLDFNGRCALLPRKLDKTAQRIDSARIIWYARKCTTRHTRSVKRDGA